MSGDQECEYSVPKPEPCMDDLRICRMDNLNCFIWRRPDLCDKRRTGLNSPKLCQCCAPQQSDLTPEERERLDKLPKTRTGVPIEPGFVETPWGGTIRLSYLFDLVERQNIEIVQLKKTLEQLKRN